MKILRNTAICFTTKRAQLLLCHKLVKDNKKDCMDAVHQHKFRINFYQDNRSATIVQLYRKHRNQSSDLFCKSTDWFQYHEKLTPLLVRRSNILQK